MRAKKNIWRQKETKKHKVTIYTPI